jgi:hypothetical protein
MAFFAGRNGRDDPSQLRGLGLPNPAQRAPGEVVAEPTGLPPWVESAVKKLLASVLPQSAGAGAYVARL